jgi:hypothetical protein
MMITLSQADDTPQGDHQQTDVDAGWADPSPWYDLGAQWLMAMWALGQLILTAWGVVLLRGTLDATREAVDDTSKATEAMLAANVIAEGVAAQAKIEQDARERENIPAVLVVDATYRDLSDLSGEIALTLENVGRQAAIDVYVLSRENYFMPEGQYYEERMSLSYAAEWLPKITKGGKRRAGAIGVNPRRITIPVHFSADQMRNCVITQGAVIYSDAGGRDYISQFFYSLYDGEAKRDAAVPMQSGTLRMATFKPYEGPELRDREGY